MTTLKHASLDLAQRIAAFFVAIPMAAALCELFRWAAAETYPITEGPYNWFLTTVVGLFYFYRIQQFIDNKWFALASNGRWTFCARLFAGYVFYLVPIFIFRLLFAYILPPFDPLIGCIVGLIVGIMFLRRWNFYSGLSNKTEGPSRGTRLIQHPSAQPAQHAERKGDENSDDPPVRWADWEVAAKHTEAMFLSVGVQGAGKTLMQRALVRSVAPLIVPGSGRGALIYDVKQDLISQLQTMGLRCPVKILNPLDNRAFAWNIAEDLAEPGNSLQYASILIPMRGQTDTEDFFEKAARILTATTIDGLTLCAKHRWTLRDLLYITTDAVKLHHFLSTSPHTSATLATYDDPNVRAQRVLNQRSLLGDVVATIAAAILPLKPIAAIWQKTPEKISLATWAREGGSILVFGNRFSHKESLMLINQVMFHRLATLLLSRAETRKWRTWLFIDELKEAGRLDGLNALITNGRSKGVRAALGFQDLQGLRGVYGDKAADELVALCQFTSILRSSGTETSEWASKRIGESETWMAMPNEGSSTAVNGSERTETTTYGRNWQFVTRRAVLASEISSLPLADQGRVAGYHILPSLQAVAHAVTQYPLVENDPAEDFRERTNPDDFLLAPWTNDDWTRLGIVPPPDYTAGPKDTPLSPPTGSLDDLPLF